MGEGSAIDFGHVSRALSYTSESPHSGFRVAGDENPVSYEEGEEVSNTGLSIIKLGLLLQEMTTRSNALSNIEKVVRNTCAN